LLSCTYCSFVLAKYIDSLGSCKNYQDNPKKARVKLGYAVNGD
jgi:hypothetical protein